MTRLLIRRDEEQDYDSLHCLTANSLAIPTDLQKQDGAQRLIQFNKQTAFLLPLQSSSAAAFPISEPTRFPTAQPGWLCRGAVAACRPVYPGGLGMKLWEPGWEVCSITNSVLPALAEQVHHQAYCPSSEQPCERGMAVPQHKLHGKIPHPLVTFTLFLGLHPWQFFLKQHYPKHLTMNCPNSAVCGAAIRRNPAVPWGASTDSSEQCPEHPLQTITCSLHKAFLPSPLRLADALKPLTFQKIFKIFFPRSGIILAVSVICAITYCFMGHSML